MGQHESLEDMNQSIIGVGNKLCSYCQQPKPLGQLIQLLDSSISMQMNCCTDCSDIIYERELKETANMKNFLEELGQQYSSNGSRSEQAAVLDQLGEESAKIMQYNELSYLLKDQQELDTQIDTIYKKLTQQELKEAEFWQEVKDNDHELAVLAKDIEKQQREIAQLEQKIDALKKLEFVKI